MKHSIKRNPLLVFYLLVVYIVIQLCWWGYHIIDLNNQISISLDKSKLWMVFGEGSVFFIILVFGVIKVRGSFKKELLLNEQQQNFLLSVTHELKSPVAAVKLYLETLYKRELSPEKVSDVTQKSLMEIERLSELVDNILLATKIDNQAFDINKQTLKLNEWLKIIYDEKKLLWEDTHSVYLEVPNKTIIAYTDKEILKIIILNLVENALKYAPKKSKITISLTANKESFVITVIDDGKGISKNEREKIFNKFYRTGDETIRNAKGTGLGLFIVKFLCEQLSGQISVYDNIPNGSCFEVKVLNKKVLT